MADRIERELGIEVEKIKGHYGEYKILVDGEILINGGAKVVLGLYPSGKKAVEAVKKRLAEG